MRPGRRLAVRVSCLGPGACRGTLGATSADGGTFRIGDVAPDVHDVAAFVAPMPGGVGPMTRAMLLLNVVEAAERAAAHVAAGTVA